MTTTALVVTTLLIIAGLYDLAAVVVGYLRGNGVKYSISRFLQWIPQRAVFFTWIIWYCLGHFWGFMPCPPCPETLQPVEQQEPLLTKSDDSASTDSTVYCFAYPGDADSDRMVEDIECVESLGIVEPKFIYQVPRAPVLCWKTQSGWRSHIGWENLKQFMDEYLASLEPPEASDLTDPIPILPKERP